MNVDKYAAYLTVHFFVLFVFIMFSVLSQNDINSNNNILTYTMASIATNYGLSTQ